MKVFLTGVACVGTTTIGQRAAELLGCPFFDLDAEIESFFGTSIERLQTRFLTGYSYRLEASKALTNLLSRLKDPSWIIALPPHGLMDAYWRIVKKTGAVTLVLEDFPENILKRITFYDIDSKPIVKTLSPKHKLLYLKQIKDDISYYRRTYRRADASVLIASLGIDGSAQAVVDALDTLKGSQKPTTRPLLP